MSEETNNDELELIDLSHRAEILAKDLKSLSDHCGHDTASADISHAADELSLLSTVLSDLVQAVNAAKDQYTETFNQDLREICLQLESIFEDVEDCCQEMHKTAVGWLRKRKYVEKLHKHMEASIRTLTVMRTVLLHGKSYGLHSSGGRLAESAPHVLQEDHVILETVFATRNAITNLRSSPTKSHRYTSSNSSSAASTDMPTFVPGAHGRNLSSATGVDTPVFEDVLPSSNRSGGKQRSNDDHLAERFAKRGVRLAVHSSFLDNNAHDIPNALQERWVHNARARCSMEQIDSGGPSNAPLGTIPEYNSSSSPEAVAGSAGVTEQEMPAASSSEECTHANLSKAKKMGRTLMAMPMGRSMGKVIRRLRSTSLNQSENKEKDKAEALEEEDKIGWTYRFTKRFERPELTTPDYNKDSENMVLR